MSPAAVESRNRRWLGSLPEGWTGGRLFQVADAWTSNVDKHVVEGEPPVRLCNYTDVYKNDAITSDMEFMAATATPEQIKRFRIAVGDTIITKDSETSDDIGIPAFVEYEAPDLICGYHLAIVRPRPEQVDPKFLFWALKSDPTMGQWNVQAAGVTRVGLRSTDLSKVTIPLPPLDEQRRIADFLNVETAQIDTLIAEQERFIGLLRQRRRAAVTALLTRGLELGVPTKSAGNDLLGEIPRHWQMVPTRFLCTITTGGEDSGNATDDGEYPFYVRGREILRIGQYSFDCEAVMTPGDGQGGTGKVFHYFKGKFEAHQRVYVFKDFRRILGRYFFHYLASFLGPVALAGSNTVTMESLRRPLLAAFPVALPPMEEQVGILSEIETRVAKIDALIAEAEHNIALSKERRAALITAAVTGQVDVSTGKAA